MIWTEQDLREIAVSDKAQIDEVLEYQPVNELWLNRISLIKLGEDAIDLAGRIDGLFTNYGADPEAWRLAYIGALDDHSHSNVNYEIMQSETLPKRLGEYIAHCCDANADIENEEDGSVTGTWFFWLGSEHVMAIEAEGQHWTSNYYKHPKTQEIISPDWEELTDLEADYDQELEYVNQEVGYDVDITAKIAKVTPD